MKKLMPLVLFALGTAAFAGDPHLASGAAVKADSAFASYKAEVVVDNVYPDDGSLNWDKSWASADSAKDHWLEIDMAKEAKVSSVEIYWDKDKGEFKSSAKYSLEYWDGSKWVKAVEVADGKKQSSTKHDVDFTAKKIRFFSPAGGGSAGRKNISWIAEIVVK